MPSINDRLISARHNVANRGCRSCDWFLNDISDDTRKLINEWIDADHSIAQLHQIISATPDEDDHETIPLRVGDTGWRSHLRHHNERCRGEQ
jgi:hypothetical protein